MAYDQKRLELHEVLCTILGSRHCYFQPPENVLIEYPCIIYERNTADSQYADNTTYSNRWRYTVTIIDENPDTDLPGKVAELPYCKADRFFQTDNLNHYIYSLFY